MAAFDEAKWRKVQAKLIEKREQHRAAATLHAKFQELGKTPEVMAFIDKYQLVGRNLFPKDWAALQKKLEEEAEEAKGKTDWELKCKEQQDVILQWEAAYNRRQEEWKQLLEKERKEKERQKERADKLGRDLDKVAKELEKEKEKNDTLAKGLWKTEGRLEEKEVQEAARKQARKAWDAERASQAAVSWHSSGSSWKSGWDKKAWNEGA
jgi:hypothetical protein